MSIRRRPARNFGLSSLVLFAGMLCAMLAVPPADAQGPVRSDEMPDELKGVEVVERLGDTVPLDLTFVDESGETIQLRDYFKPGRPVILSLNYYRCPMLCTLTLNGLVDALRELEWKPGDEFMIVTVSINPEEGPELAEVKKKGYVQSYGVEGVEKGWHFLTGEQDQIEKLAAAVGFKYRYDAKSGEFVHPASITFVTPDGRISRYMNDVMFQPRDVRLALVEASEGAIGSPVEKALLFTCFQYDPESGSYAYSAVKLMRIGGAVTVLLIVGLVAFLLWRGPREKDHRPSLEGSHE